MKTKTLVVTILALLFAVQVNTHAQNWGFSLPFGSGGFAINGKNWTAGYGGTVVGGGQRGWGFQLPNGAGFYNGRGGFCGGGYGGGGYVNRGGYYSRNGWCYGPYYDASPSQTRPVRVFAVNPNGAAVYQTENGRIWVQQPF